MKHLVTVADLRKSIGEVIRAAEKSYDVPDVCCSLGLAEGTKEEAHESKRSYVVRRINNYSMVELIELGEKVLERYAELEIPERGSLSKLIQTARATVSRTGGQIKNLIFAANGPKPEFVLSDALENTIEIVENAEYCLVYDLPISKDGLLWGHLVEWWVKKEDLPFAHEGIERDLLNRLWRSLSPNSPPERLLFHTYYTSFRNKVKAQLPALIPQVYLHCDPKTLQELKGMKRIPRQRMDFLMLLPNNVRIVVEVDGKQHYAEGDRASPQQYAEMAAEDRKLRLRGYEVYRFGGYELMDKTDEQKAKAEALVETFFEQLLIKHQVISSEF